MVLTNRYTKVNQAILSADTRATTDATIFLNDWISSYGIPAKVFTANGPKFASRFFKKYREELMIVTLITMKYHPQPNGQVVRLNATIVSRLGNYVLEPKQHWKVS